MLSIENPPPDPLLCPSQLETTSSDEKKASSSSSSSDKLLLYLAEEVDPFKPGLVDDNNNNPVLPKFSIRNYVSSARRKDITANWPFSEKNLLLCLEHGVTDPLPPFQTLDSVKKDQSFKKSGTVETSLLHKENTSHSNGEVPNRPSDQFVAVTSDSAENNQKLALDSSRIKSNNSEGDSAKKLQSKTTTGKSCPQVASVPITRDTGSVLGAPETLCESSAKNFEAAVPPASHKTETPVKKCRLIVKLSGLADPNTTEDITPNNSFMASETMGSKVCPVCKTFSSSSNTTLNAHIDQCLSGESMKWTANSKVVKHRIKPRKTKLMVDIYLTAPYCTVEELDRRNGRSWATNSNLPAVQETRFCTEEKVQRLSTVNREDAGNEGAVYIDTDGTKVRILSKFNEAASVSSVGDDPGPRKILKGDKGSKFLSTKKRKKLHQQKHKKFLKLDPHSKSFPPSKPSHRIETRGGQERKFVVEENCEKEKQRMQCFKGQEVARLDDMGTIQRSVCSERTGLPKKISGKVDCQRSGDNASSDLLAESDQSSFSHSYRNRRFVQKTSNSGNPTSSPESCKRMEISSYELHVDEYREQPPFRDRVGFSSLGSRVGGCGKKSPVLPERNLKQLKKRGTSEHGKFTVSPKCTENLASSPSSKAVETNVGHNRNSDAFAISSKPSWSHHAFSSKDRRFSSLRKNLSSVNEATVPESKLNLKRKFSALKKSRVHCLSKLDGDARVWPSQPDQQHNVTQNHSGEQYRMEEITDKMSPFSRPGVVKIRKKRGLKKISRNEEGISFKSSPECYGHHVGDTSWALAATIDDRKYGRKEVQSHGEHIVIEPTSRIAVEGSFMSLSTSLDPKIQKISRPCDSELGSEVYEASLFGAEVPACPTDPSLVDKEAMFCGYEVGNDMNAQNANMVVQLDSKDGQGNYFSKVDAIPIPGPPGSFLPSPEDMGSEDLQGYSSLTTSRAHSFEDHDMVYRDSSDSPISGTSTISNPTLARSDSRSSEKLSVGPRQDEILPCFSVASIDPAVENSAPVDTSAERIHVDDSKLNVVSSERVPLGFRNDQPCRCSRKEGASQGVSINYQESQLLKRRNMASVPLPIGNQWNSDPNKIPRTLNLRSEMCSLKNYPRSEPENAFHPTTKSPAGNTPMKVSSDAEVKFPIRSDCDSATLYAPSPVLRLMGKNLMVVNKDDNVSFQHKKSQSSTMTDYQFCTGSGPSPGNIVQDEDICSFHKLVPQSPSMYGQSQRDTVAQHFDGRFLNNFRSHINLATPQINPPSYINSNVSRQDCSWWYQDL